MLRFLKTAPNRTVGMPSIPHRTVCIKVRCQKPLDRFFKRCGLLETVDKPRFHRPWNRSVTVLYGSWRFLYGVASNVSVPKCSRYYLVAWLTSRFITPTTRYIRLSHTYQINKYYTSYDTRVPGMLLYLVPVRIYHLCMHHKCIKL